MSIWLNQSCFLIYSMPFFNIPKRLWGSATKKPLMRAFALLNSQNIVTCPDPSGILFSLSGCFGIWSLDLHLWKDRSPHSSHRSEFPMSTNLHLSRDPDLESPMELGTQGFRKGCKFSFPTLWRNWNQLVSDIHPKQEANFPALNLDTQYFACGGIQKWVLLVRCIN